MSSIDKTVAAPTALAALDQARHNIIYRPDPTVGVRGIHHAIVTTLGGEPAHGSAVPSAHASDLPATKHAERGRAVAAEPPALPTATGVPQAGQQRAVVGIVAVQPSYRTAGAARNPPAGSGRLAAGQGLLGARVAARSSGCLNTATPGRAGTFVRHRRCAKDSTPRCTNG